MAKGFLEVFPGLTIEKEFEELLKLTKVSRVTSTRDRKLYSHLSGKSRLIQQQMIL